jgi:hypothetical protein
MPPASDSEGRMNKAWSHGLWFVDCVPCNTTWFSKNNNYYSLVRTRDQITCTWGWRLLRIIEKRVVGMDFQPSLSVLRWLPPTAEGWLGRLDGEGTRWWWWRRGGLQSDQRRRPMRHSNLVEMIVEWSRSHESMAIIAGSLHVRAWVCVRGRGGRLSSAFGSEKIGQREVREERNECAWGFIWLP